MSLCRDLKTEYETLKKLTQEFVSACEKAGDPRAFSAEQLRALQLQKQTLEKARDSLEQKFETGEHFRWKKIYESALSCLYKKQLITPPRSIQELISTENFRQGFVEQVMNEVEVGQTDSITARNAVHGIHSGLSLGVFSDNEKDKILDKMRTKEFQRTFLHGLYTSLQSEKIGYDDILIALNSAFAAIEVGLIPKEVKGTILALIPEIFFHDVFKFFSLKKRTDMFTLTYLPGLYAFGLLRHEEKKQLQHRIEKQIVVERSDFGIGYLAERGQFEGTSAHSALGIVTDLKDLVELSRIRRKE